MTSSAALEMAFFTIDADQAHLAKALDHLQSARKVYVEADAAYFIERTDRNIAIIKSHRT